MKIEIESDEKPLVTLDKLEKLYKEAIKEFGLNSLEVFLAEKIYLEYKDTYCGEPRELI